MLLAAPERVRLPAAVALPATCRSSKGMAVPMPTAPLFLTTNWVIPEDEAVKISPVPELSTTRVAKDEVAEKDATGAVPLLVLTSSVARVPEWEE